jgi:hypothetical protein
VESLGFKLKRKKLAFILAKPDQGSIGEVEIRVREVEGVGMEQLEWMVDMELFVGPWLEFGWMSFRVRGCMVGGPHYVRGWSILYSKWESIAVGPIIDGLW